MAAFHFKNVNIFDGSGSKPFPGEVLVREERIFSVAGAGTSLPDEGATVIDGGGAMLMPGLVESHAHLTWPSSVERVVNAMKLPLEEHLLVTAQNARILLDHGFTSAYSAGSLGERFEPALRNLIDAGFFPGPRLRASALEKGAEGVMGVPEGHAPTHDRSIDGLRSYVRAMKAIGCDTIKFLMSSDEGFAPGGSQVLMYSEEEARVIGEVAREQNIWLAAHAQAAESIKRAVRAGFRAISIAHMPMRKHWTCSRRKKTPCLSLPLRGCSMHGAMRPRSSGSGAHKPRKWVLYRAWRPCRESSRQCVSAVFASSPEETTGFRTTLSVATPATSTCSCACSISHRSRCSWQPRSRAGS